MPYNIVVGYKTISWTSSNIKPPLTQEGKAYERPNQYFVGDTNRVVTLSLIAIVIGDKHWWISLKTPKKH